MFLSLTSGDLSDMVRPRTLLTGPDRLEDRAVPATLRVFPEQTVGPDTTPGTILGTSQVLVDGHNSVLARSMAFASTLTVPFGPMHLADLNSTGTTEASGTTSILAISAGTPTGLLPTAGVPPTNDVLFDLTSAAVRTVTAATGGTAGEVYSRITTGNPGPPLSNGFPSTEPVPTVLRLEVLPEPGEAAGKAVQLAVGVRGTAGVTGPNPFGVNQVVSLVVNGSPISLLARSASTGQPLDPATGSTVVTVHVGDLVQLSFDQTARITAGATEFAAGSTTAELLIGFGVASAGGGSAPEPGLPGGPPGAGTVGADAGVGPVVKVFDRAGTRTGTFFAFDPAFTGGVRVATADVNGDHVEDVIAGTGPGAPARVRVFSGTDRAMLLDAPVLEGFTGGVFVAAGDVTGDGLADLVVTPDQGGGPRVLVFRGGDYAPVASYFGITDPGFRGGARAAVGDVDGDGRADLVVAAGFGGGPRVAFWDGRTVLGTQAKLTNDIFVFDPVLRNGVYVAVADVNADGRGDLVFGAGPGGGPRVLVVSGQALLAAGGAEAVNHPLANFFTGDVDARGGVRVGVDDLDGDGAPDVLTGAGSGSSRVSAYRATSLAAGSAVTERDFFAFPGFNGGVFVG
jgi:hypothetical protein